MASAPVKRLKRLGDQLSASNPDAPTLEKLPNIPQIAGDSTGQRVKGKVAIITGANSPAGIGRASAHQFAQNGARAIYICDLKGENLPTHRDELIRLYPDVDVQTRQFDAADEEAVRAVVADALERYGRLDIMFANAGMLGTHKLFVDVEREDFMGTMRTNALSVFLATKYAAKAMMKTSASKPNPSGSIIATSSVAGLRSNAGSSDYSASKAAVVSLMQTSSYQLSGTNTMFDAARARGTEEKVGQLNPLQRGAVADEVARVALFLASDESSYVNGQAWNVCGGLSAGHPHVPGKLA